MPYQVHGVDVSEANPTHELSLAILAERMTDGVVILDSHARVRFRNTAFAQMLGRPDAEVVSRPVVELLDAAGRNAFEAEWPTRQRGSSEAYALCWLRGDGTRIRTRVMPIPLFDHAGRFDGSLGIVTDASTRERLAEELAIAKAIIDQTSNVLYRVRLEDRFPIEYVSGNVAHFGYSPDVLLSGAVGFEDIIHADDRKRVVAELGRHVALGHRDFVQHYRALTASGETRWVEDRVFVREIANGAGIYLEGIVADVTDARRAKDNLHQALTQAVSAIAAAIDKRDPYTAGHQRRVGDLSHAVARRLGLPAHRVEGIYLGALVHDVGKLAIPLDILTRPGRLGPEEFALVKTHVIAGVDVLKDVTFPWPIAEMVAQHHERLDGSGYPAGLEGEAICLEARIIAVADVFESMSTHRPYRPALPVGEALAELGRGRCFRFDAAVVDACTAIVSAADADPAKLWKSVEGERRSGALPGDRATVDSD